MHNIPTSPFPSGGRNPVAEATSPDNSTLYVVNEDDNTIVQFTIGSDGKIYPQNTVNTPGVFPLAVATGRQIPICRGHVPAASYLFDRGAMLRLGCGVSSRHQRCTGTRSGECEH